jgi:ribosomal-protein-alanine N-acetyltransferase
MTSKWDVNLTTARLVLEPIDERHAERLFELFQDASIYTFIPTEPPHSAGALRERFARLMTRHSADRSEIWLNWAVRVVASGSYVGTVQATVRPDGSAVVAYELGSEFRGRGYATEACQAVISELVASYSVHRISAFVDTRNAASMRLLERLGFERTRQIPNADYFKGAASDEYEFVWHAR